MKTIIIWDTCGEEPIKFFVVDGDFSHLNNVYINSTQDEEGQLELNKILEYDAQGNTRVMTDSFPIKSVADDTIDKIVVIVAGFIP